MPLTDFALVRSHFAKHDPELGAVLSTVKLEDWFERRVVGDYFQALCRDIVYQQLAGKAANTIYSRFAELVGTGITPVTVAKIPDQSLRDAGLSWAKVKYVKDLAGQVLSGGVSLEYLANQDNEAVIAELTKVKGIGRWTAEMFLIFTLHREDVFSHGDLGLKKGFAKLYQIDDPTEAEIDAIISHWSPYKSYGSISLWHYLDN